jgi:hypothetical protein
MSARGRSAKAALGVLLLAGLATAAGPASPAQKISWRLDRLDFAPGLTLQTIGKPAIVKLDGASVVRFDGAADGLVVPSVPIAEMTAFTIEAHFRPESGGGAEQRFFHTEDDAGTRALLEIRMGVDGQWSLDTFLRSGTNSLALLDRSKLHPADRWHWVALTYDGKTMRSFVDGVLELQGDVAFAPMKPKGQTSLGVRQNKVYWFKGAMSDLRFHGAALPPEKLQR